jgi:hypothetical protein
MIADELRRQADVFLDLASLQTQVGRDPSERPAREPRHHHGHAQTHGQETMPGFISRGPTPPARAYDPEDA